MNKRIKHIQWELSILRSGLLSKYGINKNDISEERRQKISNRIVELTEELTSLNTNR
tara:strand:- start:330 stop:500 length:171 start_codon:yes stop_codon:yes gene_type:complete